MQETPFSLYVTVRKKLVRNDIEAPRESERLLNEHAVTKVMCDSLSQKNSDAINALKKVEDEKVVLENIIEDLSLKLEKAKVQTYEALTKKKETDEKYEQNLKFMDNLNKENSKVREDLVRTKTENQNIRMELKETKKTLETTEKNEYRMCSKIENLENSVKNLREEIRNGKVENTKINKEKVILQNQISKLKERKQSVSKSTSTVPFSSTEATTSTHGVSSFPATEPACCQFSQTDGHPDIPYAIEEPLPPIFSSSLVHKSKSIFLSRSQPNLSCIKWVNITEEELIDNDINEIEMEQYHYEIQEFYRDATERSRALREIYEEEQIKKLFDEN